MKSLIDTFLVKVLDLLGVPKQVIGEDLANTSLPLMERYPLLLFTRLDHWPFLRLTIPRDAEDRDRAKLVFHRIMRGDNRRKGIHSHPWWFWSVSFGTYVEQYVVREPGAEPEIRTRTRGPGSIASHPPSYEHIVIDVGADGEPCWTFAVLGPRIAAWGFPFTGEVVRQADGTKAAPGSAKPIHAPVPGAPFQPGHRVRVVDAVDREVHDLSDLIGHEGRVEHLEYSSGSGQSYPDDPMIGVRLTSGSLHQFWAEELASAVN